MKNLIEALVVGLFRWIIPTTDASPEKQYSWRWRIAASLIAHIIVTGVFIAVALGAASFLGVSGFTPESRAQELLSKKADKLNVDSLVIAVRDLTQEQKRGTDDQIVRDINSSIEKFCASTDGLRRVYLTELKSNLVRYQERHNWVPYPQEVPPSCS